jgi:hypothetical protein
MPRDAPDSRQVWRNQSLVEGPVVILTEGEPVCRVIAHLGDLAVDANDALGQLYVLRLDPEDFAGAQTRPDTSEEAQSKERNRSRVVRLNELHKLFRGLDGEGLSAGATTANPVGRNLR